MYEVLEDMPAPNELVWYKWFPVKAITSLRWQSLTLAQEGFYRRLYDWAAIAQPSFRRGYLYEHDTPASIADVVRISRVRDANAAQTLLNLLQKKGLMLQDENGAWGFTNFAKHQRNSKLRVRSDGIGSAKSDENLAQNRRRIGAIEAEAESRCKETQQQSTVAASLIAEMQTVGLSRDEAVNLARKYGPEKIRRQLARLPGRNAKNPPAMFVKAVREDWTAPPSKPEPEERHDQAKEIDREIAAEVARLKRLESSGTKRGGEPTAVGAILKPKKKEG